jgi:hypothetical protein
LLCTHGDSGGCKLRDQEVGGSNPLAPTILFNNLQPVTAILLPLRRWERVASIFGFNLGIETTQLLVVAGALPSLILLSRTRLYPAIRIAGAAFAGIASAAWIVQRFWDVPNPADAVVTALAHRAGWIAVALCLLGVIARNSNVLRVEGSSGA